MSDCCGFHIVVQAHAVDVAIKSDTMQSLQIDIYSFLYNVSTNVMPKCSIQK